MANKSMTIGNSSTTVSLNVTGSISVNGNNITNTATQSANGLMSSADKKKIDNMSNISDITTILKAVYPIGSIYMSVNNTNPNSIFGFGTWVQWGSGRVPVGVNTSDGNFNSVEKTGGSNTHTHSFREISGGAYLTAEELPSTIGKFNALSWESNNNQTAGAFSVVQQHCDRTVDWTESGQFGDALYTLRGGGKPHYHTLPNTNSSSSLQPYITCYMWKRTA